MLQIIKRKIRTVLNNPKSVPIKILLTLSPLIGDKFYLKLLFPLKTGYKLDLDHPKTYNEKLQWLKLYYRNPEMTKMADKYEVKKYVSSIIGEKYIIPTLSVWNKFEDIKFEDLPNQFVLKTTHDQGGVVICKDKQTFDLKNARIKLNSHCKKNHFYLSREWPYKNIQPRIIVEKYMSDHNSSDLKDYKFFCFNGIPKALFIASERQSGNVKFNFYDMDFKQLELIQTYPHSNEEIDKPTQFEKMIELSQKLSQNLPHVRVDFYEINKKVYFGELTFFHHGGLHAFHPQTWDYKFGNWIDLPQ